MTNRNDYFMKLALREADKAFAAEEIPIGAVVISPKGEILGKGYNQREQLNDPTAHAEMLAISAAANTLGDWRLDGCSIYVTLEPCPMCGGAIVNARIETVIFGTTDTGAGACGSRFDICGSNLLNHKTSVISGVMEEQCKQILSDFFTQVRQRGSTSLT